MIEIRIATIQDMEQVLDIYRYYVENTAITFEYEVPTLKEFKNRYFNITRRYPYIVAVEDNKIVGYAYASAFHSRAAYDWAVETTIYCRHTCRKKGIGKTLYTALENILKEQGILNLNACIAYPIQEDQFLTKNSVQFHQHLGYRWVGEFYQCGYKFNAWYNMVWMEKFIGKHNIPQKPICSFEDVKMNVIHKYGIK